MRKNGKNGLPVGSGLYWKHDKICGVVSHEGKRYPFATGTDDINTALKIKADKYAEVVRNAKEVQITLAKGVTVAELFKDYIASYKRREKDAGSYGRGKKPYESSSYKLSVRINKHLMPAFGGLKPEEVTSDRLNAYKEKRQEQDASVTTINSEFRLLKAAIRRGTKTTPKKVHPLHVPDFSELINHKAEAKAARKGTISEAQYDLIMQHAPEHLRAVFVTVLYTGIRQKEIRFVRKENVDLGDAPSIRLLAGETKDGEERVCGVNERVKEVLLAWRAYTREHFPRCKYFFHLNGEQLGSFATAWNATLRRAGLRVKVLNPNGTVKRVRGKNGQLVTVWKNLVKFHDTRRTVVTDLDVLGLQEKDIMSQTGHKTVAMSRRYNQSKQAAERVRKAQNEALGFGGGEAVPVAPVASVRDWKAELRDLKETFEAGLLPEDLYRAEVQKVMAGR